MAHIVFTHPRIERFTKEVKAHTHNYVPNIIGNTVRSILTGAPVPIPYEHILNHFETINKHREKAVSLLYDRSLHRELEKKWGRTHPFDRKAVIAHAIIDRLSATPHTYTHFSHVFSGIIEDLVKDFKERFVKGNERLNDIDRARISDIITRLTEVAKLNMEKGMGVYVKADTLLQELKKAGHTASLLNIPISNLGIDINTAEVPLILYAVKSDRHLRRDIENKISNIIDGAIKSYVYSALMTVRTQKDFDHYDLIYTPMIANAFDNFVKLVKEGAVEGKEKQLHKWVAERYFVHLKNALKEFGLSNKDLEKELNEIINRIRKL